MTTTTMMEQPGTALKVQRGLAILACLALMAVAARAGRPVPIGGALSGQIAPSAPGSAAARVTGTGAASDLGHYSLTGHYTADASGHGTGTATFTFDNGDSIDADLDGTTSSRPSAPVADGAAVVGTITFLDGTGSFAGRSGTATFHGTLRPNGDLSLSFAGTLSPSQHG